MSIAADLFKRANAAVANNAQLYKLLQNWEQAGGSASASPMSANSKVVPKPLPTDLAAALAAHLKLPQGMPADELDAAETMLSLEGGGLGAAKKKQIKAAKVYEAAEPVEGTKPKEVYESHKKCTPGEFSMHKEGGQKQAVIGTTIGAVAGAAGAKPGKRVRESARGAAKGFGTDLGALVGGVSGGTLGFLGGGAATLPLLGVGAIPGGVIGALGGGYAGGRMGYNIADKAIGPYQSKAEDEREKLEQLLATYKRLKEIEGPQKAEKQSAFTFGVAFGQVVK